MEWICLKKVKCTIWFLFLIWTVFKWEWKCPKIKIMAMVDYHCTYSTNHWTVHLNWVNCILCEFHLSESKSHSVVSDSLRPHELPSPCNFPGQNTGMGSLSLLQGIFPTQELNWGLLHCRGILYQLSYQGSPGKNILQARILEWVAFPFSRGSSQPRDQTQVSHIAGDSLPAESQGTWL